MKARHELCAADAHQQCERGHGTGDERHFAAEPAWRPRSRRHAVWGWRISRKAIHVPLRVDKVLPRTPNVQQVVQRALCVKQLVRRTLARGMAAAVPPHGIQQANKFRNFSGPAHAWMQIAPLLWTSG